MLDIAPSTLRRYAAIYAGHLSPQQPGHKRGYTEADIVVLRKIKSLTGHIAPGDIPARLDLVEDPPAAPSSGLALIPEIAARFERLEAERQSAAQQINELSARLERLEASTAHAERLRAWAALPWWRRLFTAPPE